MNLALDEAIALPTTVLSTKKKNGMLAPLIILFLISYGLMSVLVVEQGRTIESQRNLIHDLLNDSMQLSALKTKELLRQRLGAAPSGQSRTKENPPQASVQNGTKNNTAIKSQRPAMQRPPKLAADAVDSRRIPLTI